MSHALTTDDDAVFGVVHALAVRGVLGDLPAGAGALVSDGLIAPVDGGYALTPSGYRRHRALLERERSTLDLQSLSLFCARLPGIAQMLTLLAGRWEAAAPAARTALAEELAGRLDALDGVLARGARVVPRLGGYRPRVTALAAALRTEPAQQQLPYVRRAAELGRELLEDYLQTLGQSWDPDEL